MFLYEVDTTTQQVFQVAGSRRMVIKFGRHGGKKVNIATLMMLVSGDRAKNAQRSDAEAFLQLVGMATDDIYIFAPRLHFLIFTCFTLQKYNLFPKPQNFTKEKARRQRDDALSASALFIDCGLA